MRLLSVFYVFVVVGMLPTIFVDEWMIFLSLYFLNFYICNKRIKNPIYIINTSVKIYRAKS